MTKALLTTRNSPWGLQHNGLGEIYFNHVVDFPDDENDAHKIQFLKDECFDGEDWETMIQNASEIAFVERTASVIEFGKNRNDPEFQGLSLDEILRKDFAIILTDGKYQYYAVEPNVNADENPNNIRFVGHRDGAFEVGMGNFFRSDRQVVMNRAHVPNIISNPLLGDRGNIAMDSDNTFIEEFENFNVNSYYPTETNRTTINYFPDIKLDEGVLPKYVLGANRLNTPNGRVTRYDVATGAQVDILPSGVIPAGEETLAGMTTFDGKVVLAGVVGGVLTITQYDFNGNQLKQYVGAKGSMDIDNVYFKQVYLDDRDFTCLLNSDSIFDVRAGAQEDQITIKEIPPGYRNSIFAMAGTAYKFKGGMSLGKDFLMFQDTVQRERQIIIGGREVTVRYSVAIRKAFNYGTGAETPFQEFGPFVSYSLFTGGANYTSYPWGLLAGFNGFMGMFMNVYTEKQQVRCTGLDNSDQLQINHNIRPWDDRSRANKNYPYSFDKHTRLYDYFIMDGTGEGQYNDNPKNFNLGGITSTTSTGRGGFENINGNIRLMNGPNWDNGNVAPNSPTFPREGGGSIPYYICYLEVETPDPPKLTPQALNELLNENGYCLIQCQLLPGADNTATLPTDNSAEAKKYTFTNPPKVSYQVKGTNITNNYYTILYPLFKYSIGPNDDYQRNDFHNFYNSIQSSPYVYNIRYQPFPLIKQGELSYLIKGTGDNGWVEITNNNSTFANVGVSGDTGNKSTGLFKELVEAGDNESVPYVANDATGTYDKFINHTFTETNQAKLHKNPYCLDYVRTTTGTELIIYPQILQSLYSIQYSYTGNVEANHMYYKIKDLDNSNGYYNQDVIYGAFAQEINNYNFVLTNDPYAQYMANNRSQLEQKFRYIAERQGFAREERDLANRQNFFKSLLSGALGGAAAGMLQDPLASGIAGAGAALGAGGNVFFGRQRNELSYREQMASLQNELNLQNAQLSDLKNAPNTLRGNADDLMGMLTKAPLTPLHIHEELGPANRRAIAWYFHMFGSNLNHTPRDINPFIASNYYFNFLSCQSTFENYNELIPMTNDDRQINDKSFSDGVTIGHYRDPITWQGIKNGNVNNVEMDFAIYVPPDAEYPVTRP